MILRALVPLLVLAALPATAEERITIDATRPGVTQTFYLTKPANPAVATLVLFTGGDGRLRNYGPPNLERGNFLVRSRALFVAEGFTVAVIDAPSDQDGGMKGFVASREHQADIAVLVRWLKAADPAPLWLVGTSRGSISAALGGTLDGVAGVVLTSSVTREPKYMPQTVYDAPLDRITVPVLIVHHRQDACIATPFMDTAHLFHTLKSAQAKEVIAFEGGASPRSEPCEALAAHGYIGIEHQVVTAISAWIKAHSRG